MNEHSEAEAAEECESQGMSHIQAYRGFMSYAHCCGSHFV